MMSGYHTGDFGTLLLKMSAIRDEKLNLKTKSCGPQKQGIELKGPIKFCAMAAAELA